MRMKIILKIILGITAFVLLVILLTKVVVEPLIGEKIQASFNNNSGDFQIKINKVHVLIFHSGIELENITLLSKPEHEGQPVLTGEIESVKFKGIHLLKAVLRKDIDIREVDIFNSRIIGKFVFPEKTGLARLSPLTSGLKTCFLNNWLLM